MILLWLQELLEKYAEAYEAVKSHDGVDKYFKAIPVSPGFEVTAALERVLEEQIAYRLKKVAGGKCIQIECMCMCERILKPL
jgi:hypothetical protein